MLPWTQSVNEFYWYVTLFTFYQLFVYIFSTIFVYAFLGSILRGVGKLTEGSCKKPPVVTTPSPPEVCKSKLGIHHQGLIHIHLHMSQILFLIT